MKVIYVEKNSNINGHLKLAEKLGISNTKTGSVEDQGDLIELLDNEKPDLLIIDSRFRGLKDSKTIRYLSKLKETTVVSINRINGVSSFAEISYIKDGFQEKFLRKSELLERVRSLRLQKNRFPRHASPLSKDCL